MGEIKKKTPTHTQKKKTPKTRKIQSQAQEECVSCE